jgi:hypothetical protein
MVEQEPKEPVPVTVISKITTISLPIFIFSDQARKKLHSAAPF